MTEQLFSILSAVIVFAAAAMRMNLLKLERGRRPPGNQIFEALGLIVLMGGCAGIVGEWFLASETFHAETLVLVGCAFFLLGISGGRLCQVVARLQGWDGSERRVESIDRGRGRT